MPSTSNTHCDESERASVAVVGEEEAILPETTCIAGRMENESIQVYAVNKLRKICTEMGLKLTRSFLVTETTFDIETLSNEERYLQFRFLKTELPTISRIIEWGGVTERNGIKVHL